MTTIPQASVRRAWAAQYIARGWPVFVLGVGKTPLPLCDACRTAGQDHVRSACTCLVCHAFHAATLDDERVDRMLTAHPTGLLAIRTGGVSRLLVIDAEATSKGADEPTGLQILDTWESWTNGLGLPSTLRQRTGGGGLHLLYQLPVGATVKSRRILPNVDIKSESGYIAVGPGSDSDSRHWENWDEWPVGTDVTTVPSDLLMWLQTTRTSSPRIYAQGVSVSTPMDYSYAEATKLTIIPDGWREMFSRDMSYRLRKSGISRERATALMHDWWCRYAQPPDARYHMPWEDVEGKIERDWLNLAPNEDEGVKSSWRPILTVPSPITSGVGAQMFDGVNSNSNSNSVGIGDVGIGDVGIGDVGIGAGIGAGIGGDVSDAGIGDAGGVGSDNGGGGGGSSGGSSGGSNNGGINGLVTGRLDPDKWYGTHDDGFAARMRDVWGDRFRAIPLRKGGGHAHMVFNGTVWTEDTRGLLWHAASHIVDILLPGEVSFWELKCATLEAEGEVGSRTARVGGNGVNAGEFQFVVDIRKFARGAKDNARKQTGVAAFSKLPKISIAESDLDAESRWVGLIGGYALDVKAVHSRGFKESKGEWIHPAKPGMLLTKQLGCAYVPEDMERPGSLYAFSNFRRYLEGVLPDEDVRSTLQEIIGYALLGDPDEKIILLLHGPSDSGKTTLLEILGALFGSYADWADSSALIAGKARSSHTEWLHKLRGLRLILTPETAKGAKIDAGWMKSYTGRELQNSRGAYGDRSVTWRPTGIIINASNHYLEYDAEDTAVAERTQVVEFEQQFLKGHPERDARLPYRIIEHELPIVLNWALEGLRRHGVRGSLAISEKIQEWSQRYRIAQDHVGQFVSDVVIEGWLVALDEDVANNTPSAHFVTAKVVYALYRSWCRVQEIKRCLGRNTFNSHLTRVYHWQSVRSGAIRWYGYTSSIGDELNAELVRW